MTLLTAGAAVSEAAGLARQALLKHVVAELVYLYQVRAHGSADPASGQPVVELNNGFRLNLVYNLDFTSKAPW